MPASTPGDAGRREDFRQMSPIPPPGGVVQPLSDFRRRLAFSLVLAITFGAALIFTVIPPLLPALAEHFGGGEAGELSAQLGLMMPSLGWLFGGALAGLVLPRVGMRNMIVGGVVLVGISGAAGALMATPVAFAVTRFVAGLAGSFMVTAVVVLLANIYDDNDRPKMIGYQKAFSGLSAIPVGLATGAIAMALGWRAPFVLYAAFGVLGAILAFVATPKSEARAHSAAQSEPGVLGKLWPLLALIFFIHILPMMGVAQLPFLLRGHGITSPGSLSLVLSLSGILLSVGSLCSGYLQAKFGPWRVLSVGLLMAAGGYIGVGLAPSAAMAIAANAVAIIGCGLYFPQYITLPLSRVTPAGRGKAIGLSQTAMYLGSTINPVLLAPLRNQLDYDGTYVVVGTIVGIATLSAIAIAAVRRAGRPRIAPAS
jgi:MFS family permease